METLMKTRTLFALLSLSLMMSLPAITRAQAGKDKVQSERGNADRTEQVRSRTEETNVGSTAEQQEKLRKEVRDRQNENRDLTAEGGDGLQEMRERHEGMPDAANAGMEAEMRSRSDDVQTEGSERAQEMRARRDERKAIKEEYESGRIQGQEADSAPINNDTVDEQAEEAKDKPKKPWWKFWED